MLHTPDRELRDRVIPIGSGINIGRAGDSDTDVAINDRLLSRRHATITPVGSSAICELVDQDSSNGCFVEGARVSRSHLTDGFVIRLGVTLFELTTDTAAELEHDAVDDSPSPFIGRSGCFHALIRKITAAAAGDASVVFVGEPGAGRARAAKRLHETSGRKGSFLVAHCGSAHSRLTRAKLFGGMDSADVAATAAEGLVPMAQGGTLLLHDIDLLDPALQRMVLELLETGKVTQSGSDRTIQTNVRIIASAGANLEAAVDAGAFSRKLCDRLTECCIEVPPLRDRRSDIPRLARHFLELEAPTRTFDWSATCLEKLLLHDWPTNLRELQNVMRRLTLVEDEITTLRSAHLPREIRKKTHPHTDDALRASAITFHSVPSRKELAMLLEKHGGNVEPLAEYYGKDRRHVYRWLTRHDLSAADFRNDS